MSLPISNQFCPHFTWRDNWQVWKYLLNSPELELGQYFADKNYFLASSARVALCELLKKLNLPRTKKIGLPAFMCGVLALPFLRHGLNICWLDTDDRGLLDPVAVKNSIGDLSLVVVPHIFGQKAPLHKIYQLCQSAGVLVVEDAAHRLPNTEDMQKNYPADFVLYSFGREKDISCVSGGAIWGHKKYSSVLAQLNQDLPKKNKHPWNELCYLFFSTTARATWSWGGRYLWGGVQRSGLMSKIAPVISATEKKGHWRPQEIRLPQALQYVLQNQWKIRSAQIARRADLARYWQQIFEKIFPDDTVVVPDNYFRIIVLHQDSSPDDGWRSSWLRRLQERGFFLQEWDGCPISPPDMDITSLQYKKGSCPRAESFSGNYLTFPTNRYVERADIDYFLQNFSH